MIEATAFDGGPLLGAFGALVYVAEVAWAFDGGPLLGAFGTIAERKATGRALRCWERQGNQS